MQKKPNCLLLFAVLIPLVPMAGPACAADRPNILIILADDLGIGDVGCYGCKDIRTPNLDALARSGIRFTNYYSAGPVCSPSRAALLTGRTPARAGMSLSKNVAPSPGEPGMPADEITIAEVAKSVGYVTGIVGKWHLGFSADTEPNAQGFDFFFGHHSALVDYYSHMYYWIEPYFHDLYRNREEIHRDGQHMTDLIATEAIRFIDDHGDSPFLLYVPFNAPHYPIQPQDGFRQAYAHLPKPRSGYAALVAGMDQAVGRILERLDRSGASGNTLVFFTSDNGAAAESLRGEGGGSNGPFREHKRSLFEGGIRMPAILRWPGQAPAKQSRDQLTIAMDLFPTIVEAIGAKEPAGRTIDGRSWFPLLRDAGASVHETLFLEWDGQIAVRQGKWKLVRNGLIDLGHSRNKRASGEDAVFLADVVADPGETKNLRRQYPDVVQELLSKHQQWRSSVAADRGRPASSPAR